MRNIREFSGIYLHRLPVDGRKGINGLASLAECEMQHSPLQGGLFVFTNKRRDVIKILYWDKTGFALWIKRLETENFRWPVTAECEAITLSPQQLEWLLDGYDISRMKPHATLEYSSFL
jgi:transposase